MQTHTEAQAPSERATGSCASMVQCAIACVCVCACISCWKTIGGACIEHKEAVQGLLVLAWYWHNGSDPHLVSKNTLTHTHRNRQHRRKCRNGSAPGILRVCVCLCVWPDSERQHWQSAILRFSSKDNRGTMVKPSSSSETDRNENRN